VQVARQQSLFDSLQLQFNELKLSLGEKLEAKTREITSLQLQLVKKELPHMEKLSSLSTLVDDVRLALQQEQDRRSAVETELAELKLQHER